MLSKRVLSACVLLPLVALVVWLGGYALAVGIALVAVLASNEVLALMQPLGAAPARGVVLPTAVLLIADAVWPQLAMLQWVVLGLPLVLLAIEVGSHNRTGSALSWAVGVAAPLYVAYALSFFVRLRAGEQGLWWLVLSLVGTWVSDSGAYFVGVRWGRRRLSESISPKKSWEGVWGGILGALVFVVPFAVLVLGVAWWVAVLLALVLVTVATIGDLGESVLKRQAGVKDSSQLIPGHGGMLDRVDSLLFVVPVMYIASLVISGL
ncbi:MAG: phosphatidate cytidylyltransferase [Chloroflexi bacterium]|jgi:phosphatidate cytidylyltransferase|nr:phosphatidate cytidylyltransferase [Chloroflexota bacterium]